MSGTRFDAIINQPITLKFQFTLNYQPFDAYSVNKVEIYGSQDDALNNLNIIETILQANITREAIGLYSYTVSPLTTAKTYFDKIYIIPKIGYLERYFINTFFVREEVIDGGVPGEVQTCTVFSYISLLDDNNGTNENIYVSAWLNETAVYDKRITIPTRKIYARTMPGGRWELKLAPTVKLDGIDKFWYIQIGDRLFRKLVPAENVKEFHQLLDFKDLT